MDFKNITEILDKAGWDASPGDNVLSARKEEGDTVTEITVDQGGGCLVNRSTRSGEKTKLVNILGRNINVVRQNSQVAQMRIKLQSPLEFEGLLKAIEKM